MSENKEIFGFPYDLVVIGSGPGGYTAAIRAAQLGAKVAVIEKEHLGGTCTNKGCIPTKALTAAVNTLATIEKAPTFGVNVTGPEINFQTLQKHKTKIVEQIRKGIALLFRSHGIDLVRATGKSVEQKGPNAFCVEVANDSKRLTLHAKRVIIATGSVPASIPGVNADGEKILTSDHILELQEIPPSLLIVGAGTIGLEFASIFNALGTKVTLVEMMPQIAPGEDGEIAGFLKRFLVGKGIEIKTGTRVEDFEITQEGVRAKIAEEKIGSAAVSIFSKVLIAVGRKPYLGELRLERLGVKSNGQQIEVDSRRESDCPGVYAIGDVTGGLLLAHVAAAEGIVAAENALGKSSEIDYRVIPRCTYTCPEMASVGLTEAEAKQEGYEVAVGKFPFTANGRALTEAAPEGLVKVVTDEETGEILGVHIIGPQATELIAQAAMALKLEATVEEFTRISWAHPTLSEAVMEAVLDTRREAIDLPRKK